MSELRMVGVILAFVSVLLPGAQAAEPLVQVGSQTPDGRGSGSICLMSDSNAGYTGLKQIVADNIKLSNNAQVADVWVSQQVVAVEFKGATAAPVEAMMPADVASRNGLHPCPGLAVAAVGGAGALALGGVLAGIALGEDTDILRPVGGLAPPNPPVPPVPPVPPPRGGGPGLPSILPTPRPVSPSF